mmetsp:Transcript_15638/g.39688  ORF Transcript_15638/g.39688 Transcript_15638/m.39688 type:complete len:95 (+) Transcript_15638:1-285(+)
MRAPTAVLSLPEGQKKEYHGEVEEVRDEHGTVLALMQRKKELMDDLNRMIASGEHGSETEQDEGKYGEEEIDEDDAEEADTKSPSALRKKPKKK